MGETFRPWTVQYIEEIGDLLKINAINASVPIELLPERLTICHAWVPIGASRCLNYYASHDGGLISFPKIAGDGSQSLRQLESWLQRQGYTCVSDDFEMPAIYERQSNLAPTGT
ncbi:MAG: hypothetical protein P4L84_11235 [Isosphaeraceae bacterium]|nr:hypothetical protein [Isosphaeraceae bacterium]